MNAEPSKNLGCISAQAEFCPFRAKWRVVLAGCQRKEATRIRSRFEVLRRYCFLRSHARLPCFAEGAQADLLILFRRNRVQRKQPDLLEYIRTLSRTTRILVLIDTADARFTQEAMRAGACEVVRGEDLTEDLVLWALRSAWKRFHTLAMAQSSEQKYRDLLNGLPNAVLLLDAGTRRILDANVAFLLLYGCKSVAWISSRHLAGLVKKVFQNIGSKVFHGDRAPSLWRIGTVFELLQHKEGGESFWAEVSARETRISGRRCILVTLRNITKEQSLQKSNAILQAIAQGTSNFVFVKDLQGRVIMANAAFVNFFGLRSDIVGKRLSIEREYPLVAQHLKEIGKRVLATRKPETVEESGCKGKTHWTHLITKSPLVDASGNVQGIASIGTDITGRKLAEKALAKSEHQLRLLSARIEKLREEERTRISREIHDELGQMLTGIKMDLHWMESKLDEIQDPRVHRVIEKVIEAQVLLDSTVTTVQRIATELRPSILDNMGLVEAIQFEAARFQERTGTACRLEMDELASLPPETSTTLFRIFQEALTNIARHARAKRARIVLRARSGSYILEIHDNGKGISQAAILDPASAGLVGMQERARMLGGSVSFTPRRNGGTVVTVKVPQSL